MMAALFKGTCPLTKLVLRKDRFKIIIWILSLVLISMAAAAAYPSVYLTEEEIMGFAIMMNNPAMTAMLGPGYELDQYNTALIFGHEMLLLTAIAVGVMNILLVGRATRADEEEGRLELVRSLPVGRLSYLSAAMIEGILVNVLLSAFIFLGLLVLNLEGMDWESCLLYGAVLSGFGLVFAGLTVLFAQLAETSRGAAGFSFAVLIGSYMLRALGDVNAEVLSMISPMGWLPKAKVFAENIWWPVFLSLGLAAFLVIFSFYLNSIRDMDAGFIQERKGRSQASALLKTRLGFILRQQRTNIIAWAAGLFFLSAAFGSVLGELETYFSDMEVIRIVLGENPGVSLVEQFLSLLVGVISLFSVVPAVMGILLLQGEENKNRTEHFYSRAVSRTSMMLHVISAGVIVTVIMQTMVGLGLWSLGSAAMEEWVSAEKIFGAAYAYLPAMWVFIALAVLLIGYLPRLSQWIWLYVVFCFFVLYFKDLFEFPEWLSGLSVIEYVPDLMVEEIKFLPLAILTAAAAALGLTGIFGYNRRDITG